MKLTRVSEGKLLGGICTGLAKALGINVWLWRILFIVFGCSGLGILLYIIMCFVIPQE